MKKQLTLQDIKSFLKHQLVIEQVDAYVEGNDSLDSQVDRFLDQYVEQCTTNQNESFVIRNKRVKRLLEAEKEKDEEQDKKEDLDVPSKKTNLDVQEFANEVARLINNVDNLLEFRNTILRRALNNLNKSYDQSIVHQFEILMEDEHGLVVGKSQLDREDEIVPPFGDHAGPLD